MLQTALVFRYVAEEAVNILHFEFGVGVSAAMSSSIVCSTCILKSVSIRHAAPRQHWCVETRLGVAI